MQILNSKRIKLNFVKLNFVKLYLRISHLYVIQNEIFYLLAPPT